MAELDFEKLPELPQIHRVRELSLRLWQRPEVEALWLGGSLAASRGDPYSDIDYRVAVSDAALSQWESPEPGSIPGAWLVRRTVRLGDGGVLHQLMLDDAELLDVVVWRASSVRIDEPVIVLGCRSESLQAVLDAEYREPAIRFPRADPHTIRRLIEDYWILTSKGRKVLSRGLGLLSHLGMHLERMVLLRLMYVAETGLDCGDPGRGTIHGLSGVVRSVSAARGDAGFELLGAALDSPEAIRRQTERHHDEAAALGRELASRLGFEYPAAVEQATRDAWSRFRKSEGPD